MKTLLKYTKINLIFLTLNTFLMLNLSLAESKDENPQAKLEKTAIATETATPEAEVVTITPVPRPVLRYGETELYSLLFTKEPGTKKPSIKINFKDIAKAEIRKDSDLEYTIKISKARISSPIFSQPQIAPADFAPFAKITASEILKEKMPVDLFLKIELSREAILDVQQKGAEIIITEKSDG